MLSGPIAPSGCKLSSGKPKAVVVVGIIARVAVRVGRTQVPAVVVPRAAEPQAPLCPKITEGNCRIASTCLKTNYLDGLIEYLFTGHRIPCRYRDDLILHRRLLAATAPGSRRSSLAHANPALLRLHSAGAHHDLGQAESRRSRCH